MSGPAVAEPTKPTEIAIFAGGCFWCMESEFQSEKGVNSVISGYTGGTEKNPTYKEVSSGKTSHVEAVEVHYDPRVVSYPRLLEIFWSNVDPTDAGGQFYDRGAHYRTMIFVKNDAERLAAEASLKAAEEKLGKPIQTEIRPAGIFYPAEDYHQDFYTKDPEHYNAYVRGSGRKEKLKKLWE